MLWNLILKDLFMTLCVSCFYNYIPGPATIDFGRVCIRSITTKNMEIINNLDQNVLVVAEVGCSFFPLVILSFSHDWELILARLLKKQELLSWPWRRPAWSFGGGGSGVVVRLRFLVQLSFFSVFYQSSVCAVRGAIV